LAEKTYYIETYGCQMNDHDSEKMAALLEGMGLSPVDTPERAGVVVINTCAIREKAEHKVYSALGRLRAFKERTPDSVAIVAGCVAQQQKEKLLRRVEHLDAVLGTHRIDELPAVVQRVRDERSRILATEFSDDVASLHRWAPCKGSSPVRSYVTVMQGCSNFCSYCVVPYTRGPEVSRPKADIVEEVRSLAAKGVKEVTLLGQNVNAYGNDLDDGVSFAELLRELDEIPGLAGIRFTTSHPKDFTGELIAAMAELPSVREHVHLPLQSGSDRILKAMGRGYDRSEYIEKIRTLRDMVPGAAITADIIVGFPGETEEDFLETVSVLEEIRYDQIFSFKFSPRPGTKAGNLPDQVPEEVKAQRLAKVHEIQEAITTDYHQAAVGTVQEVLIEGIKPESGRPFGRTRTNKVVNLESADDAGVGDIVKVTIIRGLKHSLMGVITR
jgi:tRNA-2-methylthio-N6-dimethylallyladenosine synthase